MARCGVEKARRLNLLIEDSYDYPAPGEIEDSSYKEVRIPVIIAKLVQKFSANLFRCDLVRVSLVHQPPEQLLLLPNPQSSSYGPCTVDHRTQTCSET